MILSHSGLGPISTVQFPDFFYGEHRWGITLERKVPGGNGKEALLGSYKRYPTSDQVTGGDLEECGAWTADAVTKNETGEERGTLTHA